MPNGALDLDDDSLTPNTRACYPLNFIGNAKPNGLGGVPRNVVMLTADAFGVMPPLARLTPAQAMHHFLSGYTARVAGTEKGLGKEPSATFSACFGAPFLPRPPQVYGELLRRYLSESKATPGSSTPAGPAAPMASASAFRSPIRGRCCARRSAARSKARNSARSPISA